MSTCLENKNVRERHGTNGALADSQPCARRVETGMCPTNPIKAGGVPPSPQLAAPTGKAPIYPLRDLKKSA